LRKTGKGYLVDRASLGHWKPMGDAVVQTVRLAWRYDQKSCQMPGTAWIYGTPAVWEGPDATHVYVWGSSDYLRDYALDANGHFTTHGVCFCAPGWTLSDGTKTYTVDVPDPPCAVPSSESPEYAQGLPGGVVAVSSNGKEPGTGIVWATRPNAGGAVAKSVPGTLEAFDATFLRSPIWTSGADPKDAPGNWAKFTPPTIANGKVYLPTQSGQLVVYGLKSSDDDDDD